MKRTSYITNAIKMDIVTRRNDVSCAVHATKGMKRNRRRKAVMAAAYNRLKELGSQRSYGDRKLSIFVLARTNVSSWMNVIPRDVREFITQ